MECVCVYFPLVIDFPWFLWHVPFMHYLYGLSTTIYIYRKQQQNCHKILFITLGVVLYVICKYMFTIHRMRPYHHESRQRCRGKCAPILHIALPTDAILTVLNTSAAISTIHLHHSRSRPNKRVELRMERWIV